MQAFPRRICIGLAIAALSCCAACGVGGDRAVIAAEGSAVARATPVDVAPTLATLPRLVVATPSGKNQSPLLPPTPLQAIFNDLNRNTAATARGEYFILQELSAALSSHIDELLQSPPTP